MSQKLYIDDFFKGTAMRKKGCFASFLILLFIQVVGLAMGQDNTGSPKQIRLWSGDVPGALGTADHDIPTLTLYTLPPERRDKNNTAIVIFPGGGYGGLASHEGKDYALWFNKIGIQAFVLKYRLGSKGYRHPIMLGDAARAIRLVRARSKEWGIDNHKIGVIGSSAGGHLASTILTHFDEGDGSSSDPVERFSSRPDFGVLCYPVITMGVWTHQGSKNNLLGRNPSHSLVWELSNERHVTPQTPPCFIWHTAEDKAVHVNNAFLFASALTSAGVPFDIHVYQKGRHGIGLQDKPPFDNPHPWARDLKFWIQQNNWIE